MVLVPLGHQVVGALANVLTVEDGAREGAWNVDAVIQGRVGAEGDREGAVKVDAGGEGPQAVHLDGAARAVEFDDVVTQFHGGLVDGPFHQPSGARQGADQFGLLDGIALLDAGTVGVDRLDAGCGHGTSSSFTW